jgi:pyruvate formate lyase activating enzyme
MEAKYYDRIENNRVHCHLCPHECVIHAGKSGVCRVRSNVAGTLMSDTYGSLSAVGFDPLEKKPLYHFHPGKEIFSLGSLGCNFKCYCCQNYHISQTGVPGFPRIVKMDISSIISTAKENHDNIGIAYTYNEPSVWYEYMLDIAIEAQKAGLKNVMVSNGYINPDPLKELLKYIDAFNIDLKTFDKSIHLKFTGGNISNVLDTLVNIVGQGRHLEITYLAIPEVNDNLIQFGKMIDWISENLGKNIPLHLSRYFPQYKMTSETTPLSLLMEMASIAGSALNYVYIGNVPTEDYQNTTCPNCGHLVITRRGYFIQSKHINSMGNCGYCNFEIAKV